MTEKSSVIAAHSRGRPRRGVWSTDQLLDICARVARGETLTAISREHGQPSAVQFRTLVMKTPVLRDAWDSAKSERPHSFFEEAIDIARDLLAQPWGKEETNTVKAKQIAIDVLRVAAARLAPREYGERPATQTVVPVQINTTLALTPGSIAPTAASVYQIEASIPETP